MNTTMYDKLLQLPLFQGLCKSDMTKILEKVKLHFQHFSPGEVLVNQGDQCNKLLFLLDGTLLRTTFDRKAKFTLHEEIECPQIIEPYTLYGMDTSYFSEYSAATEVGTVSIDKEYVLKMLQDYPIFLLNLVNMMSNRVQTLRKKIWNSHIGDEELKIVDFISHRCLSIKGKKVIDIKMDDMATLLNEPRINISRALNKFQRLGLVELTRMRIIVPTMEDLNKYVYELNAYD